MGFEAEVNPAMVVLAREARGLTQTELAQKLGISQSMLSKVEAGVKVPSDGLLQRLVSALEYPEGFFFQTDTVYGPGLNEFFHRRRQDVGVKALARIHAQINIIRMHISRLMKSVEIPEQKIRLVDLEDFHGRPQEVARAVRAAWQLPRGPIANVVKTIEDAGGIIVRCPFGTQRVDAITRWVPGLPPLFFVNEGLPTDRERLTLCHELGHLILHDVPSGNMEAEANRFAAEFLMPAPDILPHLDRVTLDRLAALKPHWRVSMAALLYRATELKKISTKAAQVVWAQMSLNGFKRREPAELDLAPETPTLLQEILAVHRDHFGYGLDELSRMLATRPIDLIGIYKLGQRTAEVRPTLRIVRHEHTA